MIINGVDVQVDHIKNVMPEINRMLLEPIKAYESLIKMKQDTLKYFIIIDNIETALMRDIVFEYINFLKKKDDPRDRVAWHEWHKDGLADFVRLDRLIEKRKTRKEVQTEINEMMKDIQEYRKYKLNCDFLEVALRKKLGG